MISTFAIAAAFFAPQHGGFAQFLPGDVEPVASGRIAAAEFCGVQSGFGLVDDVVLYNLREPVGPHPVGSTVSAQTILRYGYALPLATKTDRAAQTGLAARSQFTTQAARGAAESHDLVLGGATPPPAPICPEVSA